MTFDYGLTLASFLNPCQMVVYHLLLTKLSLIKWTNALKKSLQNKAKINWHS